MNRWQDLTDLEVNAGNSAYYLPYECPSLTATMQSHCLYFLNTRGSFVWTACVALLRLSLSEFLIHAADVEGLCQGIDEELVASAS